MEKINIAEILKDCPNGMELNCVMNENVYFGKICDDEDCIYPIRCYMIEDGVRTSISFTKYGEFNTIGTAKCVIYPKGKTTWEGFVPPCQFKDGDILVHSQNQRFIMSIYNKRTTELLIKTHCILWDKEEGLSVNKEICCYADSTRLATEEEKQKLLKAIKDNGYRWNTETKTLEQLIEPKFKVGDVIQDIDSYKVKITEVNIEDECYGYESMIAKGIGGIGFNEQDNWELVPNKFDITTLKPFDKVLVRDCNGDKWNIDFFACYRDNGTYQCMTFTKNQCIPYENNQHLLDTKNDCDEFYKTW